MRQVPLVILGAGKVGRALVTQLLEAGPFHAQHDGILLPVVAWCDSDGAAVADDGLAQETLQSIQAAKESGTRLKDTSFGYRQEDPAAIVDVAGTDGCIVVDVTASHDTVPALELALRRGYGVATANKRPLAGEQALFDRLLASGRFRYESTVGSAVPVIETARALVRAADRVDAVRGVLSGTLGFIFTGLQDRQAFSSLVVEAMRLGFTEADPRADLGGQDVARKALILARTLGWRIEPEEVVPVSLVPSELAALPLERFMASLPELDGGFAGKAADAARTGAVLRYVAELSGGAVTVGVQAVPDTSALGRLRGNDNLVAFHTRYYPDEPLVLQGRGAGVDAAAAGVHADIVALAQALP